MSYNVVLENKSLDDLIDIIYPVGSVYISVTSTNPKVLFGGEWTQIKDTFLLACGNSYANGATGGEAQHTLTVSEMPNHAHTTTFYNDDFSNGGDSQDFNRKKQSPGLTYDVAWMNGAWQYSSKTVGGGNAHNNMPPYLAVYMWKRIS